MTVTFKLTGCCVSSVLHFHAGSLLGKLVGKCKKKDWAEGRFKPDKATAKAHSIVRVHWSRDGALTVVLT